MLSSMLKEVHLPQEENMLIRFKRDVWRRTERIMGEVFNISEVLEVKSAELKKLEAVWETKRA